MGRYWLVDDLSQHLIQSALDIARKNPTKCWDEYFLMCHKAFTNSLSLVKSRHKSEYFAFTICLSEIPEGRLNTWEDAPPVIGRAVVHLDPAEVSILRERYVDTMRRKILSWHNKVAGTLALTALESQGNTLSQVLDGMGVTKRTKIRVYSLLHSCTKGIADLDPEDIYYLWSSGSGQN